MTLWKKNINGPDDPPILKSIYSRYPAFKNMGAVTLKADTNFTRDKTGVGDIEYFDNENKGRQSVIYNNGYEYKHPNPGTHGIVYNPKTNDEQNIMLDMLHGMPKDPIYKKHRDEFKDAFIKTFPGYMSASYKQDVAKFGEGDGYEKFVENEIDGQIRTLMYEGDRSKDNYSEDEAKLRLGSPEVNKTFTQLKNYLKTGVAYTLPETVINANSNNQNKIKLRNK